MRYISELIKKEYPVTRGSQREIYITMVSGTFFTVLLIILKPFGQSNFSNINSIIVGFGAVCIVTALINILLVPKLLPHIFIEEKWNIGKEILFSFWYLSSIAFVVMLYSNFIGITELAFSYIVRYELYTLLIGIVPITIKVLATQVWLLKKHLETAQRLNQLLTSTVAAEPENKILELQSESGAENIKLPFDQLLFIEALQNYIQVVWHHNGRTRTTLLRLSLKSVEEKLTARYVVRCHRSYIVNLMKISRVLGNAQGYKLIINQTEKTVPIARRSSKKVLMELKRLRED